MSLSSLNYRELFREELYKEVAADMLQSTPSVADSAVPPAMLPTDGLRLPLEELNDENRQQPEWSKSVKPRIPEHENKIVPSGYQLVSGMLQYHLGHNINNIIWVFKSLDYKDLHEMLKLIRRSKKCLPEIVWIILRSTAGNCLLLAGYKKAWFFIIWSCVINACYKYLHVCVIYYWVYLKSSQKTWTVFYRGGVHVYKKWTDNLHVHYCNGGNHAPKHCFSLEPNPHITRLKFQAQWIAERKAEFVLWLNAMVQFLWISQSYFVVLW